MEVQWGHWGAAWEGYPTARCLPRRAKSLSLVFLRLVTSAPSAKATYRHKCMALGSCPLSV